MNDTKDLEIKKQNNEEIKNEQLNILFSLKEEDLDEKFIKSPGPGGQNVNKVATCVQLKHIPTGIEIKCSSGRTQAANRTKARKILTQKVLKYYEDKEKKIQDDIEKQKRKNRKKPQSVKIKILEDKKLHSQKKQLRSKIIPIQDDSGD